MLFITDREPKGSIKKGKKYQLYDLISTEIHRLILYSFADEIPWATTLGLAAPN